ncbi:Nitrogen permease regulator 2 [Chytriomyces hyalinus]|nr:Nitrogen permease regulator 2 [Chytriomyces hyalinus]
MASCVQQTLIDVETLEFLEKQRAEDTKLVQSIDIEKRHTEFIFAHTERFNNWAIDEVYIQKANKTAAAFLADLNQDELDSLMKTQMDEAASQLQIQEDERTFNIIIQEMRGLKAVCDQNKSAAEFLSRFEEKQKREMKALTDAHARKIIQMDLSRHVVLRDVEDAEIRVILRGLEFNKRNAKEERNRLTMLSEKEAKVHKAKVLVLMNRNQLEIEQLRERHIVQRKFTMRYLELETDIVDENDLILLEHEGQEQALANSLKQAASELESENNTKILKIQIDDSQRRVKHAIGLLKERNSREAVKLEAKQAYEGRKREFEFWAKELVYLRAHLTLLGLPTDGSEFSATRKRLLIRFPESMSSSATIFEEVLELNDDPDEIINFEDGVNIEAHRAKENAQLHALLRSHQHEVNLLKQKNAKLRKLKLVQQQKALEMLLSKKQSQLEVLERSHSEAMKEFDDAHKIQATEESFDTFEVEKLYSEMPSVVLDVVKNGSVFEPRQFNDLAFLTANLVGLSDISRKSTPTQMADLFEKLNVALEKVIEGKTDVYKLPDQGGSFSIVIGLNMQGNSSIQDNVLEAAELAHRMNDAVRRLDMTGQAVGKIQIKIGIHAGSATGGIFSLSNPQFVLLGESMLVLNAMEETSRASEIHVSAKVHELLRSQFLFDVSESIVVLEGKPKVASWWLMERRSRKTATPFEAAQ